MPPKGPKAKPVAAPATVTKSGHPIGFFPEDEDEVKLGPAPKLPEFPDVRGALLKYWTGRDPEFDDDPVFEENQAQSSVALAPLTAEKEIATVRKQDVFSADLTEDEQRIISQKVAEQRLRFQQFERRLKAQRFRSIKHVHSWVTPPEAFAALEQCNNDEEEASLFLTNYRNLQEIRKKVAKAAEAEVAAAAAALSAASPEARTYRPARVVLPRRQQRNGEKRVVRYARLALDQALAQNSQDGWSEARIKAYAVKDTNANAYYYRFNDIGEAQKNGKWDKGEQAMFFKRMAEVGVDGQWGIFSMVIPGRVGYQCSNFYRSLVKEGKVKDENYVIDEKGQLRYIKGTRGRAKKYNPSSTGEDGEEGGDDAQADSPPAPRSRSRSTPAASATKKKPAKRKRRKGSDDDDDDDDEEGDEDFDYRPTKKSVEEDEEAALKQKKDNPLPGVIDPMTMDEVVKPAISPFGHVLSYSSWSRILFKQQVCPFTKKTLKKRDLVVLTWENIDEYRGKMITNSPMPADAAVAAAAAPRSASDSDDDDA